jgi:hypothetical protein
VAFSSDNQCIYALSSTDDSKPALREINLSTNTMRVIPLRELADHEQVHGVTLAAQDEIRAVASGDSGNILFITGKDLWAFEPRSSRARKLCSAPAGSLFVEIAYDAKNRAAYVTTTENGPLFMVKNGRDLVPVNVRRHEQISYLAFISEGKLFYEQSEDVWYGEIKTNGNSSWLEAERYARGPQLWRAAGLEETGLDYPVVNLAAARDGVYVQVWRYHNRGRGFGALLKLPPPARNAGAETYSSAGQLPIKELADTDRRILLGASSDGSSVYYTNDDRQYLVINGRTQKLQLREASREADAHASSSVGANSVDPNAEPSSSATISSDAIAAVAEREIDAISTQNIDSLISVYADKVDLLDKGMVSKDTVRNEWQEYFDRWPTTKWKLAGRVEVKPLGGSRYQLSFPVNFEVANPAENRRIIGTANETRIVILDPAGSAKVVQQREKIVRSRKQTASSRD